MPACTHKLAPAQLKVESIGIIVLCVFSLTQCRYLGLFALTDFEPYWCDYFVVCLNVYVCVCVCVCVHACASACVRVYLRCVFTLLFSSKRTLAVRMRCSESISVRKTVHLYVPADPCV